MKALLKSGRTKPEGISFPTMISSIQKNHQSTHGNNNIILSQQYNLIAALFHKDDAMLTDGISF